MMADVTIKYKGANIATMDASGTKTLNTSGKYCEGDVQVVYADPEKPTQSKTVTPTASGFTVSPDSGKVLSSVVVNGDADLIASNIRSGKNIFGVDGTLVEGITPSGNKALTPSTTAQTNIDVKNYATASVAAITKELLASLDTDFVAENIKKDVDLFGLVGTLAGGGPSLSMFDIAIGEFVSASDVGFVTVDTGWGSAPNSSKFYGAFFAGFQPSGVANSSCNLSYIEFHNSGKNGTLQNYRLYSYGSKTATSISGSGNTSPSCVFNNDGTVKLVGYSVGWYFGAGHKYLWGVFKEK